MAIYQSSGYHRPPDDTPDNPCEELDNLTQKSINRERTKICDLLYESSGEVAKQEEKYKREKRFFNDKKCLFIWTEENYRRFRNLDISVGSELLQTNESVKANVGKFSKWNKDLNAVLKNITKQVKDAKVKFSELKDFACKLESCIHDKCNTAQLRALTGKAPGCEDVTPIDACKDAESILDELVCRPKGLTLDIDSIFQSSADVVGIQIFSNIDTLEPLQKTLTDQSVEFEKHINEVMKLREGELKKLQDDLIKCVKDITMAAIDRNSARSNFEGYYDTVYYLCCPTCTCVVSDEWEKGRQIETKDRDCERPRLDECADQICEICRDVKVTFCCDTTEKQPEETTAD
jgi:hypothetical protein